MHESQPAPARAAAAKPAGFVFVGPPLFLALLLFAGKAIHIDDTVFVGVARHILSDPLHPYRFEMNWLGQPDSLWLLTLHPPLHCYLLAIPGLAAGMNEFVMHVFCGGLAVGCAWIMFSLAARFCKHPMLATLMTILTPAFFISATTLMADISMLFFWLLAIRCAVWAVDSGKLSGLWLAALAGSAAAMTKYFAIAIVPLLFVYVYVAFDVNEPNNDRAGRARQPAPPRSAFLPLLILSLPLAVLIAWGVYAQQQPDYGFFHPFAAAHFSTMHKSTPVLFGTTRTTLAFLGSTLVWPLLLPALAHKLPRWLQFVALCILVVTIFAESAAVGGVAGNLLRVTLFAVAAAGGVALIATCIASLMRRPDADSLLLVLWCLGTVTFAAFFNWCVNARVLVPAVFPASLLVVRWLEGRDADGNRLLRVGLWPVAALTLSLAIADYQFAAAGKEFAQTTVRELIRKGETVTFAGHWGLQYYMELEGARALDHYGTFQIAGARAFEEKPLPQPGEIVVYPTNNSGLESRSEIEELLDIELISERSFSSLFGLHLMNGRANAGFYSSVVGSYPFGISPDGLSDRIHVYRVVRSK